MKTHVRLFLEEQSDQGLHCLSFWLHLLDVLLSINPTCSNFRVITEIFSAIRIFRLFTVMRDPCTRLMRDYLMFQSDTDSTREEFV